MSEKKWTPGPWSFDGSGPHNVFGCEINNALGDCIAASWHGRSDEAKANAHLISAAPDLYDALEVAKVWLEFDGRFDMQGINAALAKARGERGEK